MNAAPDSKEVAMACAKFGLVKIDAKALAKKAGVKLAEVKRWLDGSPVTTNDNTRIRAALLNPQSGEEPSFWDADDADALIAYGNDARIIKKHIEPILAELKDPFEIQALRGVLDSVQNV
jgi:hypothetical protein